MRTIESILDQMRESLEESNSDLASFPEYGNLYAIFRAVAASILQQDAQLNTINSNLFLNTAAGEALDFKASEFNLTRNPGSFSTGSIVLLGNSSSIPSSTILTDKNTGLQFSLNNQVNIISNKALGTITCTEYTELGNLKAGTELFSGVFSNIKFIVASSFDSSLNVYRGNLIGGRNKEDDDTLKTRILATIRSLSLSNIEALALAAKGINGIEKISIVENVPSLGYITVYINNTETKFKNLVKDELDLIKPIGCALIIKSFLTVPINININVEVYNNSNISLIQNRIKLNIEQYINNLNYGSTLTKEAIAAAALKVPEVFNVNVVTPTSNIQTTRNELFSLENINISYI